MATRANYIRDELLRRISQNDVKPKKKVIVTKEEVVSDASTPAA